MEYSESNEISLMNKKEVVLFRDIFEKYCPLYMSYGMTYDENWYDACFKAKYYREMYKLKLQQKDELMWEQGMYIYEAIIQCSPILHPFSKETKPLPYTEKPHLSDVFESEEEKQKQLKQQEENEKIKAYAWMKTIARFYKNKGGE